MRKSFLAAIGLAASLSAGSVFAVPGWNVTIQDEMGEVGGTIDNMTEGEFLNDNGGAAEHTDNPLVINYFSGVGGNGTIGGDSPFGGGFDGSNDFALSATGYVTGIEGPDGSGTGVFRLNVNSDDGFSVKVNGNEVGRFENPRGPGTTTFDAQLTNGDFVQVQFFERGGGEEVEFFQTLESNTIGSDSELVGAASTNVQIDTEAPAGSGFKQPLGWTANVYTAAGNAGLVGTTVDNMDEGDTLIDNGVSSSMFMSLLIDAPPFPGATANDFAVEWTGYAHIIDGDSGLFDLFVNSDDGFRLLVNGMEVGSFEGTTGNSNTFINDVFLQDGDLISVRMFERGGGEKIDVWVDLDGDSGTGADRSHLGLTDSGILISKAPNLIPEPATAMLGLLGAAGLLARRRRLA